MVKAANTHVDEDLEEGEINEADEALEAAQNKLHDENQKRVEMSTV